jgi:hypothetical protein
LFSGGAKRKKIKEKKEKQGQRGVPGGRFACAHVSAF